MTDSLQGGVRNAIEAPPVVARQGLPSRRERWLGPAFVLLLLALWEALARADRISTLFFPAPTITLATLWEMTVSGEMVSAAALTLFRLSLGLLVGGTLGLILGLAMGWSRRLRLMVDPLVAAVHPIPKISILPLVLIIFGLGETSKVVLVALAAFFPMLINAMAGVRQIHPLHFEVARNYGASADLVLRRIILPGSLPLILTGARLAINTALVIVIAVELLTAREGLGAIIWLAWETMRTKELYATLVVIAGLGIGFNILLRFLSRRLAPWEAERSI